MIGIQSCVKLKTEKTVEHVPKYVSEQMHIFIKDGGCVELKMNGKRQYSEN